MSPLKQIFVTGASGCVGHYVVEALLAREDCHLTLLMRDPGKFRFPLLADRVTVIRGDVVAIAEHAAVLARMDAVVHLATAWGDPIAYPTNVEATLTIARAVDPDRCKVLYFSTASILDAENRPMPIADLEGTDYIRSKYLAYVALSELPRRDHVIALFPTLIFGGSRFHPESHLTRGLPTLQRYLWLLRHVTLDGTLHFIHAWDIARMVSHLIDHPAPAPDLVLGNEAIAIDALIGELCAYHALPRGEAFDLTPHAHWVARMAGPRMNSWDRYCLKHQHFRYRATNPRVLGLAPGLETISQILDERQAVPRGFSRPAEA